MRLFLVMGIFVILCGLLALFAMKESPDLQPHVEGSFWRQFASVFNFKKYFSLKELVWVNLSFTFYFIAFNMYFAHLGNYMIYYLGFTADQMGLIEGISLILSMLLVLPATALINRNKSPLVCIVSVFLGIIGLIILSIMAVPAKVDTSTIFNLPLMLGVFFVGAGYVVILQTLTVWSKQLYPTEAKGQFEGIRIIFYVLIPMCVAPLLANPVIKASGEIVNQYGLKEYLPTETLLMAAIPVSLLTLIPLAVAGHYHNKRIKAQNEAE